MKIESTATKTVVGGTAHTPQKFTIDANQISFIVLSSRMYNDPKRAIVRELSCNAWDAHVMAGKKDVPFEIHLPTDFEPYFRITDHGIGMSHDDVMNLYCKYFSSSKNNSNECIGAMGLGSKSPFCYTISHSGTMDATGGFTVVSWFDGVKRIYSAYVENGTPTIVCLSEEEDTTRGNGFEVEFAVNTTDVWEFENKAKLALEFFQPMPVVNVEGFQPVKAEYTLKTEKWGLRKNPQTAETSGLRAIQGNVQYAVGNIDVSRMSQEQLAVSKLPLDIFFPIGDLSVAANREMLSNDQRTLNNILNALTEVHKGVTDEIRKQLESCSAAWEARIKLMGIMATPVGEIVRQAYNRGDFFVKYRNFSLPKDAPNLFELDFDCIQLVKYTRSGTSFPGRMSSSPSGRRKPSSSCLTNSPPTRCCGAVGFGKLKWTPRSPSSTTILAAPGTSTFRLMSKPQLHSFRLVGEGKATIAARRMSSLPRRAGEAPSVCRRNSRKLSRNWATRRTFLRRGSKRHFPAS